MLLHTLRLPAFKGNPGRPVCDKQFNRLFKVITWIFAVGSHRGHYWIMKDRIVALKKASGPTFLVQYLKECTRVVQKFIAGQPVSQSEGNLVSLTKGLPKLIPGTLRGLIRARDPVTVRAVLTVLSLYKVLKCRPNLKINSITDAFTGISRTLNPIRVEQAVSMLPKGKHKPCRTLVSVNAGPNHKKAFLGLSLDALALSRKPRLLLAMKTLACNFFGLPIYDTLKEEIKVVTNLFCNADPILAKLSFLKEPAGKVRVVAILDGWTQMILSGLHDSIQSILSEIPQDGTMNQAGPIDRLVKGERPVYSFDLTAATDRLPIELQAQVLRFIYNKDVADAWVVLVRDRDYRAKSDEFNLDTNLRYSVGQPMGALSSFNMLAITHHIIVQIAAINCGYKVWFDDYALLGDDIVICNSQVANAYKVLMEDLGLELSPTKGLVSPIGVFEFCKRLIGPVCEFSPLGMKGISVALKSPNYIPNLFVDLMNKGYPFTSTTLSQLISEAPRFIIKSRKVREAVIWTLVGLFGLVKDGFQIGPGKTLDLSVELPSYIYFLRMLSATSAELSKKEIQRNLEKAIKFVTNLEDLYSKSLVHVFRRLYFLLPPWLSQGVNAISRFLVKKEILLDVILAEFPSFQLVQKHVEEGAMRAQKASHLVFQGGTKREMDTPEHIMDSFRGVSNGEHMVKTSCLDIFTDTQPAILQVGQSVRRFWKEFETIEKAYKSRIPSCIVKSTWRDPGPIRNPVRNKKVKRLQINNRTNARLLT
jgi:hypothetical protein